MSLPTFTPTGNTSGFSQTPIRIELQAPTVPDLTIIDLPGIIRTTTSGQSMDVIMQVNSMIEDYLRNERTIILCVIPANQDIATIDILEVSLSFLSFHSFLSLFTL